MNRLLATTIATRTGIAGRAAVGERSIIGSCSMEHGYSMPASIQPKNDWSFNG